MQKQRLFLILLIVGLVLTSMLGCQIGPATEADIDCSTKLAKQRRRVEELAESDSELAAITLPARRYYILFVRALAEVPHGNSEQAKPVVEKFIAAAHEDDRGGELLYRMGKSEPDQQKKVEIYRQVTD